MWHDSIYAPVRVPDLAVVCTYMTRHNTDPKNTYKSGHAHQWILTLADKKCFQVGSGERNKCNASSMFAHLLNFANKAHLEGLIQLSRHPIHFCLFCAIHQELVVKVPPELIPPALSAAASQNGMLARKQGCPLNRPEAAWRPPRLPLLLPGDPRVDWPLQ